MKRSLVVLLLLLPIAGCRKPGSEKWDRIRVVTYNLEDVRTADLMRKDHPRLRAAARVLQLLRPDIVLLNEVAYDEVGAPGFTGDLPPGSNGQRFAENYLSVSQGMGLKPLAYKAFMRPSNTGHSSGFDLDHDGRAVTTYPPPAPPAPDGSVAPQTNAERAYGNDCWGFGTFPGQYAMTLLAKDDLEILEGDVRTFQHFRWKDLPGAVAPTDPETGEPWYGTEAWDAFPLSSKSHWDVPVRLYTGQVVHVLASHPTPAAFDGPERRNKLRNRDEIRFWNAFLSDSEALVDDDGNSGGLPGGSLFVLLGDLNADPDEGSAIDDPVGTFLLSHPSVNGSFTPVADSAGIALFPDLDPDDTAQWGMRADYILPSNLLTVDGGGIVRSGPDSIGAASDHFPVYLDVETPRVDVLP